jgi:hypothetical protein
MLCELDHGLVDVRYAVLLRDEHVARWRRPLEAEEVILSGLCSSIVRIMIVSKIRRIKGKCT